MEPQSSGIKTWQWVVTVIIIIVLIIVGIMVFGNKNSSETPSSDNTASTSDNAITSNRLVVSDQYPGNVVYISSAQLSQPSWVVIQADNSGQPGAIIGSMHFNAGINPGKITLTKPTVEGGTYYAVIYTDDGSGVFSATNDQPLKDSNGNIILQVFHASASANTEIKG